jgi:mRNA deadenylase 3'-5' endonuclease subunit Ccr4
MKKQKKAKPKRKQKLQENKHQEGDMKNDWVDDLKWMPSSNHQEVNQQSDAMFSIISWNVLADSYCSYRSHRNLPLKFQRHVFDGNQRQHHVRQALRRFTSCLGGEEPILALQEVDGPLMVMDTLKKLGYAGLESPTSKGGKNGRVDACGLYYPKEHWKLLKEETLRLDDLASLRSSSAVPPSARNNLQGLQTSFLRKNMALLVRLVHKKTNREIVMAVLHLYWNREYFSVLFFVPEMKMNLQSRRDSKLRIRQGKSHAVEGRSFLSNSNLRCIILYVLLQLCQIHYILQKAKLFCNRDGKENTPFIVCGDFNRCAYVLVCN